MKFLYEKVYSNQYFALVLFATIAVLLILFGIVLLAAIRDTKKRKLAELEKLEKENINALQDKAATMSNDDEVFGITSFKEESKAEPLEFFKNEDEESKTRDIVLTAPTSLNSMNNLLNEFEDDKQKEIINEYDGTIINNNSNLTNLETEHKDIVVPEIEIPIKEMQPNLVNEVVKEENSTIQKEVVPAQNIVSEIEIPEPVTMNYNEMESVLPKIEVPIQNIKEEHQTLEENEDEFELPAIKNVNLEKSISANNTNSSGIDFGKTGILNFSNIENETYDIK